GKINKFKTAGHELGSHTITHPDLTTLTTTQVNNELSQSKTYLQNTFGVPINYFATPYGAYNKAVKDRIMAYYTVHRTVDTGYNSKDNFDVTKLKVQNILDTTTPEEVAGWAKKAYDEKTWLILVYHRVANDPEAYDTTPAKFQGQMQAIKTQNIPVKTITQALAELQPQR
ncbi:MAG TPA: polysaccharide deacetylase family protein, partial [Candidatus Polarisedimenticolaceae bacterium]|nr:polysaccharide deacetylase family protein [Candidatus Polarisedimenticolaceae bacterium]